MKTIRPVPVTGPGMSRWTKWAGAVLLVVLVAVWVATQSYAHYLRYQSAVLGGALWTPPSGIWSLYEPWAYVRWCVRYHGKLDDVREAAALRGALAAGGVALVLMLASVKWRREGELPDLHGSARWSSLEEIEQRGTFSTPEQRSKELRSAGKDPKDSDCVVVGMGHVDFGDRYGHVCFDSSWTHMLIVGPTGSGKGVCTVVPTMLEWTGSVLCTDIKGELWRLTGAWRSRFSHVVYFNPAEATSARWNPLDEIQRGITSIKEVGGLMEILTTKDKWDAFWDGGAKELLTATALHVMHAPQYSDRGAYPYGRSLGTCSALVKNVEHLLEDMFNADHKDPHVDAYCHGVAEAFLTMEGGEKIQAGMGKTASAFLSLWNDPIVALVTSESEFSLMDLQFADKPVSLYVVIPPGEIARLSPLVRLFFELGNDMLCRREDLPGRNQRLLMLMDEFPRFGRMNKVSDALSYTRSYGIKWAIITQTIAMLEDPKRYGAKQPFLGDTHTQIYLACNDTESAKKLSEVLGDTSVWVTEESEGNSSSPSGGSRSRNKNKRLVKRALMHPNELQDGTLRGDEIIVCRTLQSPERLGKLEWWRHERYIPRGAVHWRQPSARLHDFPERSDAERAHIARATQAPAPQSKRTGALALASQALKQATGALPVPSAPGAPPPGSFLETLAGAPPDVATRPPDPTPRDNGACNRHEELEDERALEVERTKDHADWEMHRTGGIEPYAPPSHEKVPTQAMMMPNSSVNFTKELEQLFPTPSQLHEPTKDPQDVPHALREDKEESEREDKNEEEDKT